MNRKSSSSRDSARWTSSRKRSTSGVASGFLQCPHWIPRVPKSTGIRFRRPHTAHRSIRFKSSPLDRAILYNALAHETSTRAGHPDECLPSRHRRRRPKTPAVGRRSQAPHHPPHQDQTRTLAPSRAGLNWTIVVGIRKSSDTFPRQRRRTGLATSDATPRAATHPAT